jgi:hypothetical protein
MSVKMPKANVEIEYNKNELDGLNKVSLLFFEGKSEHTDWIINISQRFFIDSDNLCDIFPAFVDKDGRERMKHMQSEIEDGEDKSMSDYNLLNKLSALGKKKNINLYFGGMLLNVPTIKGNLLLVTEKHQNSSDNIILLYLGKEDINTVLTKLESLYETVSLGILNKNEKQESKYIQWRCGDHIFSGWNQSEAKVNS